MSNVCKGEESNEYDPLSTQTHAMSILDFSLRANLLK